MHGHHVQERKETPGLAPGIMTSPSPQKELASEADSWATLELFHQICSGA